MNWLLAKIESSQSFMKNLWTTDEAHFHLEGQVNSKNKIYWGSKRPTELSEKPLHSRRLQFGLRSQCRGS